MITDIFTKPDPAEMAAQQLADYLAADSILAQYMVIKDGRVQLLDSKDQVSALSLLANQQQACIAVGLPAMTPVATDDKGITGSMHVDIPVTMGVDMRIKYPYEVIAHRLMSAIVSRQHYMTQDINFAGLAPYLLQAFEVNASDLGELFSNFATAQMIFRTTIPITYQVT